MESWQYVAAMIFWFSFVIIFFFVLFNFLIAIIVDAFMDVKDAAESASAIYEDMYLIVLRFFRRVATPYSEYSRLLRHLIRLGAVDTAHTVMEKSLWQSAQQSLARSLRHSPAREGGSKHVSSGGANGNSSGGSDSRASDRGSKNGSMGSRGCSREGMKELVVEDGVDDSGSRRGGLEDGRRGGAEVAEEGKLGTEEREALVRVQRQGMIDGKAVMMRVQGRGMLGLGGMVDAASGAPHRLQGAGAEASRMDTISEAPQRLEGGGAKGRIRMQDEGMEEAERIQPGVSERDEGDEGLRSGTEVVRDGGSKFSGVSAARSAAEGTESSKGSSGSGSSTMEAGSSTMEAGSSTMEAGSSTMEAGSSTMEAGSSTMEAGSSTMEAGSSTMEVGSSSNSSGGSNSSTLGTSSSSGSRRGSAGVRSRDEVPHSRGGSAMVRSLRRRVSFWREDSLEERQRVVAVGGRHLNALSLSAILQRALARKLRSVPPRYTHHLESIDLPALVKVLLSETGENLSRSDLMARASSAVAMSRQKRDILALQEQMGALQTDLTQRFDELERGIMDRLPNQGHEKAGREVWTEQVRREVDAAREEARREAWEQARQEVEEARREAREAREEARREREGFGEMLRELKREMQLLRVVGERREKGRGDKRGDGRGEERGEEGGGNVEVGP
ncbi:unnamed protein product [Closterium sp. NIES-65]|nr:unnamed protein product [Closterium sp. NIES-65]